MVLNIRLTTDKVPEVFAVFEIVLKDGTVVKTNAVLDKLERVVARYIYRGEFKYGKDLRNLIRRKPYVQNHNCKEKGNI